MLHQLGRLVPQPLVEFLAAAIQPGLIDRAVEEIRVPHLLVVPERVILVEVMPAGTDAVHHVQRQRLVTDRHPAHELVDHVEDFVHQHHERRRGQRAVIQPTAGVVDQVGADGRRGQAGERHLRGGLGVRELGVGAAGRAEEREAVALGHLRHRGDHHAVLRRAVGEDRGAHVHLGRERAVDEGRARPRQLRQHQPAQRLRAALDDLARQRGRRGAAALRRGEVDQRDAMLGAVEDLFDGRIVVEQRRDRLGVVDDRGRLAELRFAAGDDERHFIDVSYAVDVFAAEDQRLLGVGEDLLGDHAIRDIRGHVVGHADRHHPGVIGQRIGQRRGDAAVIAGEAAALIGEGVQVVDAVEARPEPVLVAFEVHLALAPAVGQDHAGGRLADGIFHHPGWDADTAAVDMRAGAVQQLQAAGVGHLDARALEQLQRGLVDLLHLLGAEHGHPWSESEIWTEHLLLLGAQHGHPRSESEIWTKHVSEPPWSDRIYTMHLDDRTARHAVTARRDHDLVTARITHGRTSTSALLRCAAIREMGPSSEPSASRRSRVQALTVTLRGL